MDWKRMSYRPVHPLYGDSVKERLRNQAGAGALPASAGAGY